MDSESPDFVPSIFNHKKNLDSTQKVQKFERLLHAHFNN